MKLQVRSKYLISSLFFACTVTWLPAQDRKLSLGIGSSIDFNSYTFVDDRGAGEFKGQVSLSGGLLVRYTLNAKLWVGTKLFYSSKSYKEIIDLTKYKTTDPNDPILSTPSKIKISYSNKFLELPLEIGYKLYNGKVEVFSTVGLINSFRIGYNGKISSDALNSNLDWGRYNGYLLSGKLGIGFLMKLKDGFGFYIEPQARIYINKVHTSLDQNPFQLGIELQLLKL
jgi:hypothetical protein